jgi:hypothetical protein
MEFPSTRTGFQDMMSGGDSYGDHILKPGTGRIYKPLWDGSAVVFRPLPGFAPGDRSARPALEPYRYGPGKHEYGQWFQSVVIVKGIGSNPQMTKSFVVAVPGTESAASMSSSPVVMLERAISSAVAERREPANSAGLLKGAQGRGAAIAKPSDSVLVHALIIQRGNKVFPEPLGWNEGQPMAYMLLSRTARDAMVRIGDTPSNTPNAENWWERFAYPDIVSLRTGAFVCMYKQGHDPRQTAADRFNQQAGAPVPIGSAPMGGAGNDRGGRGGGFESYDAHVEYQYGQLGAPISKARRSISVVAFRDFRTSSTFRRTKSSFSISSMRSRPTSMCWCTLSTTCTVGSFRKHTARSAYRSLVGPLRLSVAMSLRSAVLCRLRTMPAMYRPRLRHRLASLWSIMEAWLLFLPDILLRPSRLRVGLARPPIRLRPPRLQCHHSRILPLKVSRPFRPRSVRVWAVLHLSADRIRPAFRLMCRQPLPEYRRTSRIRRSWLRLRRL